MHHPYRSAATNETDLEPLINIVEKHHGMVVNGHDHCLGHFFSNNTNFILSGAAGYPQAGDCNNGTAPGPYALYLAANNLTGECNGLELILIPCAYNVAPLAANGFVTMDISKDMINVEYYARDMEFENGDLYPVDCDLKPSYSFQVTQKAT
jgi:tartrate-resistant acid phosphatase type 5